MTVRTARLGHGATGAAGVTAVAYTCPTGKTAIVKDIRVASVAGGAASLFCWIASGTTVNVIATSSFPAGDVAHVNDCWLVLEPGDTLNFASGTANAFHFHVSGAELQGVAP